jgi:acyl-CoA reductase-like NAD-dependent aldehyde dehydrogenase
MGLSTHTNGNGVVANGSPLDWKHFYNTIDGKLRSTAKTRHGLLPATGEPGPEVPLSTLDDLEEANTAAKAAFETWSEVPWQERRDALLAFADALEAEKEPFSQMLTKEQGKPLKFARLELDLAVHWIRVIAKLELPEEKMVEDDNEVIVRYTPLGVTVAGLAFLNSGQICLALKRIFVHESIVDKFIDAMVKATQHLKG